MRKQHENSIRLLLRWAAEDKGYLILSVALAFIGGLCTTVPYFGVYRLMDTVFSRNCTYEIIAQNAALIAAAVFSRFLLYGLAGAASHPIKARMGRCFVFGA
ncbi:MAG: hypothetical protein LBL26_07455 [Peptococcaceae bacterium]|jgi:ATP-binding cassette subfamily B protein|nr:hypothetical protein [Peptococcaceae bacterium]